MKQYLLALICVCAAVGELTGTELNETQGPKLADLLKGPVPVEVDWRKVPNRVSAVKDQGECDSSYAFAVAGLLEGQQAKLNMSGLIPLSVQQLLDCSEANQGCDWGVARWAINDTVDGIQSEADYPYESKAGKCRKDQSKSVMKAKDFSYLNGGGREDALMKAVANYGPVAVTIQASSDFKKYGGGIFNDLICTPKHITKDHSMLVVGYGTDEKHGDYWILKNSMGTKWGEAGYMRMKRGVDMCGITSYAFVAIF